VKRVAGRLREGVATGKYVVTESRPAVQCVFALRFVVASGMLVSPSLESANALVGWLCLSVAIYVFNGISDVTADLVNLSARPIAAGLLSIATALGSCALLSVIGLFSLARQGVLTLVLGAAFLFVGWAYSAGPAWKEHPIGFAAVIALGAGLTYAAGWSTLGAVSPSQLAKGIAVSLWVGMCCACKDFSDIKGDRAGGRRTWPVLLGRRRATYLISGFALSTSAAAIIAALYLKSGLSTALVLLAGSIGVTCTLARSARGQSRDSRRLSYRVFLSTQYLANFSIAL
jgi:4-hydroxybenzoate polyprenyltransferase